MTRCDGDDPNDDTCTDAGEVCSAINHYCTTRCNVSMSQSRWRYKTQPGYIMI